MLNKPLILLGALSLLAGCASQTSQPMPSSARAQGAVIGAVGGAMLGSLSSTAPIGAVIGGIAGGAISDYFAHNHTLVTQLAAQGVQIQQVGQQVRLLLPADRFFQANSPAYNTYYYPVLDQIALLLTKYPKISVQIAGYTDNVGSWQRNLALSKARAQRIASYLWDKGMDARFVYAAGFGEQQPIADNSTSRGRASNRRIEITLQELD